MSRKSPGLMGAGMGAEDCVPADVGTPAVGATPPASFQIGGASFGLGKLRVSCDCGKLATPEGNPDVFGVGACARSDAPAPSNAISATTKRTPDEPRASRSSAAPTAIQSQTKNVME